MEKMMVVNTREKKKNGRDTPLPFLLSVTAGTWVLREISLKENQGSRSYATLPPKREKDKRNRMIYHTNEVSHLRSEEWCGWVALHSSTCRGCRETNQACSPPPLRHTSCHACATLQRTV